MAAKRRTRKKVKASPPEAPSPNAVEFHYIFPDTYNPVYSNGVYGGIAGQGDISIHFYHERAAIPYRVIHALKEGQLAEETAREPRADELQMVRYVTTGVVMNLEAAKRLQQWLGEKIAGLEILTQQVAQLNSEQQE